MQYLTTLTGGKPIVITIGNFDGIHKGHQDLLHTTRRLAAELECLPVLLTFTPHALKVVRPEIDLHCLTTLEEKLELARVYGGIADSIVIEFTQEVMAMSATAFMDSLRARFNVRGLVVGENFSLGHNRMGDLAFLQSYGVAHAIVVRPVMLKEIERQRVSSTRIRGLISEGRVEEARELLGYSAMLHGIVVHGDQRGRVLGFPTANIRPPADKLIPANGIYAARVKVQQHSPQSDGVHSPCVFIDARIDSDGTPIQWDAYTSAVSVGVRPTFDGRERLVEAYLLDVEGLDLYGKCLSIHFITRLRDEERFASIEALKAQIAEDVRATRLLLQKDGQE